MSQRRPEIATGLLKFYSQQEVVKYMKDVAEYYQKESEKYGDKLGGMLRAGPGEPPKEEKKKEEKKKEDKKGDQKQKGPGGWMRMGTLLLNPVASGPAMTEVMYQIHEEFKQKLARVNEAIKSFEMNASTMVPQNAAFQLYVRNGVPERVIVDVQEEKKAAFSFDAKFRVV